MVGVAGSRRVGSKDYQHCMQQSDEAPAVAPKESKAYAAVLNTHYPPTHPPILSPNVQVVQVHAHGAVRGPHSSRAAPKPAQQEEAWEEVGKKLGPAQASRTSALGAAPGGAQVPSNNAEDGGQACSRGQRV